MTPEWFGILLLAVLFGAIFIGFPIAFTLILYLPHSQPRVRARPSMAALEVQ